MSLSFRLRQVDLTLECKYCGHVRVKKGSWFLSAYRFQCEGCGREVPITYSDKVALFNKYAHLIPTQTEIEPSLTERTIRRANSQLRSPPAKAPRLVAYAGRGDLRDQYR
jgi:hypothetical protein